MTNLKNTLDLETNEQQPVQNISPEGSSEEQQDTAAAPPDVTIEN